VSEFLQQIINGVSLGSIYALIALGYTMVYGVLRFINFAHSDVFMLGAFAGFYLGPHFAHQSIFAGTIVLLLSMLICAIIGVIIERVAYRPLRVGSKYDGLILLGACVGFYFGGRWTSGSDKAIHYSVAIGVGVILGGVGWLIARRFNRPSTAAPSLNVLITAIGVSLLLENGGQFVFGPNPKPFPTLFPERPVHLGSMVISSNQVAVLVITVILIAVLQWIVLRTKLGTAMRALSFNPLASSLVGINNDIVISFTFALGSALAAAGGILYSLNYPSIEPLMGILPGLKAFVAAVLGGIGNIPGAALGGLLLGVVETFVNGSRFSTWTDAIAFAILILILLLRPAGLLGKSQVEKV
jgi:branched-chain amino acid transport system permease protein